MFVLMAFLKIAVEDFLLHDLYELTAFSQRQTNADRLKEVFSFLLNVTVDF
jgi:RAD51-like protein 3